MEIWYYIKTESGWVKSDYDTYNAYNGVKEIRSPTYGLMKLQKILQPLRYC